jgi:hypothetical protein
MTRTDTASAPLASFTETMATGVLADHTVNDQMADLVAGAGRLAKSLEAEAAAMSAQRSK